MASELRRRFPAGEPADQPAEAVEVPSIRPQRRPVDEAQGSASPPSAMPMPVSMYFGSAPASFFGWQSYLLLFLLMPVGMIIPLWLEQESLIYHPRRYRSNWTMDTDKWLQRGLTVSELDFHVEGIGNQTAYLAQHWDELIAPQMLYAVFGGNAMIALDWLEVLAKKEDWYDVAFVLVDYPGYGKSQGRPGEQSIGAASAGALAAARRALAAELGSDAALRLGVLGHSLGCAAALQLVATAYETEGLEITHAILSSPFTTLPSVAGQVLPPLRLIPESLLAKFMRGNVWDNTAAAAKIVGYLKGGDGFFVDIIHSKQDEIVLHENGRELYRHLEALGAKVEFTSVDDSDSHNDILGHYEFFPHLERAMEKLRR